MEQKSTKTGEPGAKKKEKARIMRQLPMGIMVPTWWRGRVIIPVAAVAALSVGLAVHALQKGKQRLPVSGLAAGGNLQAENPSGAGTEKTGTGQAAKQPLLPENSDSGSLAYEEALPSDLIEHAPVIYPDADGPRFTVSEEYVPQPLLLRSTTGEPDISPESAQGTAQTATLSEQNTVVQKMAERTTAPPAPMDPVLEELLVELSTKRLSKGTPSTVPSWQMNAAPFDSSGREDLPMIAIVIDDMGMDQRRSKITANLPGPLTLSYLTYAENLPQQTGLARQRGHELMLHVPMQPESTIVDPGPQALKVDEPPGRILDHFRWGLSRFEGYVGINNHMGSRFTRDLGGMRLVLAEVKRRGLLFLDSRTATGSAAAIAAQEFDVPFATRNVFLDHVDDADKIGAQLVETERLARKNGSAIAIGHPRDATIRVLAAWIETLDEKGFVLAPVSAIIRNNWKPAPAVAAISDQ